MISFAQHQTLRAFGIAFLVIALANSSPVMVGHAAAASESVTAAQSGVSQWAPAQRSAIRLIAGERLGDGSYRAALEIRLDKGFKTYWRTPGDSGLPPVFDWSASTNVAEVSVSWPFPERLADPVGTSNIYHDNVVVPLIVRPERADSPVKLALKLDFGVCSNICIPATAEVSLSLPPQGSGLHARTISSALERVPVPVELGAAEGLAIVSVVPGREADKPVLKVTYRAPAPATDLFVEGPEPWLFGTPRVADTGPPQPAASGLMSLIVPVTDAPGSDAQANATGTVRLRLTLVSQERAIETSISLDASPLRP